MLIPGAAPHRPRKRWPAERFGALAAILARAAAPVVVGSAADAAHAATIRAACPAAIDLTGRTTLLQLAAVLAGAAWRSATTPGRPTSPPPSASPRSPCSPPTATRRSPGRAAT